MIIGGPKRQPRKKRSNLPKIFGFSIISGLIEFLVIILINMTLFLVALYFKPEALPYVLGFFVISCLGSILWRKKN